MILWSEILKSQEMARMNNWKSVRDVQYKAREVPLARELPLDRELPPQRLQPHPRLEQGELEGIVAPIDEHEAFVRHRQALANRWFGYYKKCKSKRMTIIDQYNKIATMKERT